MQNCDTRRGTTTLARPATQPRSRPHGVEQRSEAGKMPGPRGQDQSDLSHTCDCSETAFIHMQAIATKIAIAGCQAANKVAMTAQPRYRAQDARCCSLFSHTMQLYSLPDKRLQPSACKQARPWSCLVVLAGCQAAKKVVTA